MPFLFLLKQNFNYQFWPVDVSIYHKINHGSQQPLNSNSKRLQLYKASLFSSLWKLIFFSLFCCGFQAVGNPEVRVKLAGLPLAQFYRETLSTQL